MTFTAEDIRPAALGAPVVDAEAAAPLPPPKPQAEVEAEFRELLEETGVRAPAAQDLLLAGLSCAFASSQCKARKPVPASCGSLARR